MTIAYGYVANHKFWDEMGRIAPNVEYSESHRPHFEAMPAPWLPTVRYDEAKKAWFVVSVGKVVAYDHAGCIVPAGLRKSWNSLIGSGSAALTYTATDYANFVVDLTTGVRCANTTTNHTEATITAALLARGLIHPGQRAMDFISKPIGIASYNYYKASGPDWYNPATLYQHGFRPQALVAITCDYVCTYPVFPAKASTEVMQNAIDNSAGALLAFINGTTPRAVGWFGSTAIHGVTRYASDVAVGDSVVGYMFLNAPLSHVTAETLMTASVAGLTRQVSAITEISAAGDYFLDYDVGMLFLYEASGDAIPSPWSVAATITYYHYAAEGSATNTATFSTYACATGDLEYGDFLTYDDHSNLIKATLDVYSAEGYDATGAKYGADPDYAAGDDDDISLQLENAFSNYTTGIIGQVIGVQNYPRDYLERVKTAYEGNTDVTYQTPGSATGGRSNQLTYTGSAERMVLVNLICR